MLRPVWLMVVIMVAVCPAAAVAATKSTSNGQEREQAAVAQVEQEWVKALNHADVQAIGRILADDFIRPAPQAGQFITKADLLRYYGAHLSPNDPNQRRIEDMTVSVYGMTAIARGLVITADGQGWVLGKLLFTDVFVKRHGKWQAVSAQENRLPVPAK
ncbi:MAG: nuclear transport factor 2 family protein [Chlamydiota bacterium]